MPFIVSQTNVLLDRCTAINPFKHLNMVIANWTWYADGQAASEVHVTPE